MQVPRLTRTTGLSAKKIMHTAVGVAILFGVMSTAIAQDSDNPDEVPVQLRTLTLNGNLPDALRQQIVSSLQGGEFYTGGLQERVRQKMRDAGYYEARVLDPEQTDVKQQEGIEIVDVSVRVVPGDLYKLGEIKITGASAFPSDQLRKQFPVESGSLFNEAAVSKGLDQLKTLYQSQGYVNFGAIPRGDVDEEHHIVNLTIEIDEGGLVNFGHLILDGVEPRAGAAKSLTDSWKDLAGKRYSPELLKQWLAANTSDWPKDAIDQIRTENSPDPDPHVVNVVVHFQ
ncbi:MAG TPA: POTRA domain-containing protein [Terracidiphilus sp.]|nr:POTRA domain-containing protein [Terracidiphilus sp.]